MKKFLTLLASVVMSASAFAQWVQPVPATQDMTVNDTVYLYNVEAKGFLLGANDWNTRASVSSTKGYKVIIKETVNEAGEPTGTYWICDSVETQKAVKAMFADNEQSIWVDNVNGANKDQWLITLKDGAYEIANKGVDPEYPLGVAEIYEGKTGNTRLWLYNPTLNYSSEDESGEEVIKPKFEGAFYSKWAFVSKTAYNEWLVKGQTYDAAQQLKKAIDEAKAAYPSIDFSAQEAVYNNTSSTLEEVNAAKNGVDQAIKDYLLGDMSKASPENPYDVTSWIVNPSFETGNYDGWSIQKSKDTGVYPNTNGTYHCDNTDGDYIFNTWDWGYHLTQKIAGLPKGIYTLKAMVTSSDDCTNVFMTVNSGFGKVAKAVELQANEAGSKQQHLTEGEIMFALNADTLEIGAIGCEADGKTCNWTGKWWYKADNFRLYYLGNNESTYDYWRKNAEFGFPEKYDVENTFAMTQLLNDYNTAHDDFFGAKTSVDEILYAYEGLNVLSDSIKGNSAAYDEYQKKIGEAQSVMDAFTEGEGAYTDLVWAYLESSIEPGGFPEEDVDKDEIEEEQFKSFPNGSFPYIEENKQLTTEEVKAEIEYITDLLIVMKNKTPYDGMDFTSSIKNANFSDSNGAGWTWEKTRVTNFIKSAGFSAFPCAEAWHGSYLLFDVYQEVTGVPDGIYEINANAFYRPNGNGDVNPETQQINAFIYMNDFESPVKHIAAEGITADAWNEGVKDELACGEALSQTNQGWYLQEALGLYTPNGMRSASQAFERGMYKQTVYGLVEGGKMRLGIHKNVDDSETYTKDQWCLWTNFKLTYRAKNPEAVASVLDQLIKTADKLAANKSLSEVEADKLTNVRNIAQDALDMGTDEEQYTSMKNLNAALKDARAAIQQFEKAGKALDALNDAINVADEKSQDADVVSAARDYYDDMSAKYSDKSISTAEIEDLLNTYQEKIARLGIIGDWTKAVEADETTYVNLSSLFNSNFDEGNINGWTDTFTEGNHGYQSNATYEGTEGASLNKFVEAWRSGNVALTDGKVSTTIGEIGYSFMPTLPLGKYILKADVQSKNQGDENLKGGAFLFATTAEDTYTTELMNTNAVTTVSLEFEYKGSGIELGIMTKDTKYNWLAADNFKLILVNYAGDDTAVKAVKSSVSEFATPVAYYSISGARVAKLQNGINIVKMSDGSVRKVLVK